AAVQKKKQQAPPPKRSKTTAVLVILGIVFGLMIIGFIVIAALGKNKKPKLAREPDIAKTPPVVAEQKEKPQPEINKVEEKPEPENKPEPEKKPVVVQKPEPEKKPVVVQKPEPEKKIAVNNPDRFKQLLGEIRKGIADRGSNPVEVQALFDEAYPMADSVAGGKKQLDVYFEEFESRRDLAKRLALNEVVQAVRNFELKKEPGKALDYIDSYNGPFSEELKEDLAVLREKTLKRKESASADPAPDMKKPVEEKTEEMKKEEVVQTPVENVTIEDLAEKIGSAQTSIALILFEKVQEKYKDKVASLIPLKPILENAEEDKINASILAGFKKLLNTQISITNKGQKLSGQLLKVDEEDSSLSVAVSFNGRSLNRSIKLDDIHISDKLPLISGKSEIERVLLRTIYMIRTNDLIGALKYFDNYTGPLKKQIRQTLLTNLNGDSIGALSKVLELLSLPDIAGDEFVKQVDNIKVIQEDAWLASYLLNKYKVDYSSTEYYLKNEKRINALSQILNRMASTAKTPSVIVSEEGKNGTKTLENALREAKSGEVIRILPGVYEGTLEIRQRSISLYGATGVIINKALKVSESRCFIKQLTFTDGNILLSNDVGSVDIVNCLFTKDGVNLAGGNTSITIKNSVLYGIDAGENKRTKVEYCTILERTVQGNGDSNFVIKGFINGEVKNSIILANKNYGIRFSEKDKSSCAYKSCLIFAPKGLALMGSETIGDVDTFKKEVARVSNLINDKPEFIEPVSGDYRLKDFTPGFLAGEDKKSIGVQMNATLKLLDVE
ncbi:MAG: right-handed parallel beta-helix repeat-containing protein, partial [Lentisphaeraceae bacterium]|nr:right-handed parallel beta-helix repeat-containing protein [Lentisphaeraceae bacterium]